MRIVTPRATPMVRTPAPSAPPPSEYPRGQQASLLRAPVIVITPINDLELREGALLIGRLPECDVMLDDGLVSRMHARISIHEDVVMVEDLHSTNGVYLNGARITHSALLREGDRLLVGTTEVSLFEARAGARVTPLRGRRDEPSLGARATAPTVSPRPPAAATLPAERRESFGKLQLPFDQPHLRPLRDAPEPPSPAASVPSTARADALEVIGSLAERLAASGNLEEARRVLSAHLTRILEGATAGLTVPADLCALASRHSLALSRWTGQASWMNYVVELHLAARQAMGPATLTPFEALALSGTSFDRELLVYYLDSLGGEQDALSGPQRLVLARLVQLAEY